jgi:hypothetical protein
VASKSGIPLRVLPASRLTVLAGRTRSPHYVMGVLEESRYARGDHNDHDEQQEDQYDLQYRSPEDNGKYHEYD